MYVSIRFFHFCHDELFLEEWVYSQGVAGKLGDRKGMAWGGRELRYWCTITYSRETLRVIVKEYKYNFLISRRKRGIKVIGWVISQNKISFKRQENTKQCGRNYSSCSSRHLGCDLIQLAWLQARVGFVERDTSHSLIILRGWRWNEWDMLPKIAA